MSALRVLIAILIAIVAGVFAALVNAIAPIGWAVIEIFPYGLPPLPSGQTLLDRVGYVLLPYVLTGLLSALSTVRRMWPAIPLAFIPIVYVWALPVLVLPDWVFARYARDVMIPLIVPFGLPQLTLGLAVSFASAALGRVFDAMAPPACVE